MLFKLLETNIFHKNVVTFNTLGPIYLAMHKDWSLQCHFLVLKSGPPFLTVVERGSFSKLHYD